MNKKLILGGIAVAATIGAFLFSKNEKSDNNDDVIPPEETPGNVDEVENDDGQTAPE
ncbi:MAG: hypothetical protein V6Z82_06985 [Flavobacteriales bacterium]